MEKYTYIDDTPTPAEHDLESFFIELVSASRITSYVGVCYDIRGMRAINNQVGMDYGTRMMRHHAHGIISICQGDAFVARKSGDEYIALFSEEYCDRVIEYLKSTEVSINAGEVARNISCNAGYYRVTERCDNYEDMREILIEALSKSRSNDNNDNYAFCNDDILVEINERREVASMFEDAIIEEEFLVYYQPKVDTDTYRLKGAEALCRWKHKGEMVLPYKFIPVFEKNGSICILDYYMLDHVCRDIRRWLDEGREAVRVSVNLSREHIVNPNLVEHIINIIDKRGVPHEYIEIEITETSTEVDYVELKSIVNAFHDAGIHTSVDDFGVGYSSMNLLIEFPWDMVKIDRSFVPLGTGDEEDKKRFIMMRAIVNMADELDIECIAEGVETLEQMLILKSHGCSLIQGYLFDKPLPVEEFEIRLDELKGIKNA